MLLECEKRIQANIYCCLSQNIANQLKLIPQQLFYVPIFSNNFNIVYRRSKQKESDEHRTMNFPTHYFLTSLFIL